jgi:hypothetical protein
MQTKEQPRKIWKPKLYNFSCLTCNTSGSYTADQIPLCPCCGDIMTQPTLADRTEITADITAKPPKTPRRDFLDCLLDHTLYTPYGITQEETSCN